jgi:hypothetical protein
MKMDNRQLHRNGVECTHGRFLHETCKHCRIAELEIKVNELETDLAAGVVGVEYLDHWISMAYKAEAKLDILFRAIAALSAKK